jgi:hypothetical protein
MVSRFPSRNSEMRLIGSLHPVPSREEQIAMTAYWRAAQRQFGSDHEPAEKTARSRDPADKRTESDRRVASTR